MIKTFSCKKCGACCQKFGFDNRDYLPLYNWEVEEIKFIAKEKNIQADIRPVSVFYCNKNKKIFAIIYGLFSSPCPFYSEKSKCTIYEKRPFVCRTFPLFWVPKTVPDKVFGNNCFGYCRKFDHHHFLQSLTKKSFSNKIISRKVHYTYKDIYQSCLNSNKINLFLTKLLKDLEKKDLIYLKKLDLSKIKITPQDFFDFLIENKILSKKRINILKEKFNLLKEKSH